MDVLTIEYKNNLTGANYVRFNVLENEKLIRIYCIDDETGANDKTISINELNANYSEAKRYFEEA